MLVANEMFLRLFTSAFHINIVFTLTLPDAANK